MTRAIQLANVASGGIIQIQQTIKADTFSSSETTNFVDITGLSVAITPKFSSSKVLVSYRVHTGIQSGGYGCALILVRGSTNIALGDTEGSRTRVTSSTQSGNSSASGYQIYYQTIDFLDSPSTTSATTYKLTGRGWNASAGNFHINRSDTDGNSASYTRPISIIQAMEIAQ